MRAHLQPKVTFETKPVNCPACGRSCIVDVVYAPFDKETEEKVKQQKLIQGNEDPLAPHPTWGCTSCGTMFYKEK
ncbi:hypothetical protein [Falsiporphyromonas endometrii]|uniref:Uncharacterized protein n=1 Tax=Falsiporphyromonas endometrii TaxID=1387297 RepID=A0ABV9K5J9_9PORP